MRSSIAACWSALREAAGRGFFSMQHRHSQPDQSSLPLAAVDGHVGGVAVKHLEPLGHVGQANAGTAQAGGLFQQIGRAHAHAVVLNFNRQLRIGQAAAQVNAAAFDLRGQAVLDGNFPPAAATACWGP